MRIERELLPGAVLLPLTRLHDPRGSFVKTYARGVLAAAGLDFDFAEEFYSYSGKDVVRGMHFQVPPHDHVKLVYCAQGAVLDVLLDLRPGRGYGRSASVELSGASPALLYIPKGIAHGFRALEDQSLMVYKTSTEYAPEHDRGLRYDSFGFDWSVAEPVLSARDRQHPTLADFESPF